MIKVIQTIKPTEHANVTFGKITEPTDIQFYSGESYVGALSAVAMIVDEPNTDWYTTTCIRIEMGA